MGTHMTPLTERLHALLRWSEKYTKTDMVYLTSGSFWLTLGQVISSGSSFVLSIAFGNFLPPAAYGVYKYAITLSGIVSSVSLNDMGAAVIQAVARGYEGVLKRTFLLTLLWSIPMFLISMGGAVYYLLVDNLTLAASFLLIAVTTPFFNSATLYSNFLHGRKDFQTLTHYQVYRSAVPVATLLATLYFTHNPLWLIATYFLSNTLTALALYWLTLHFHKPNEKDDPEAFTYGKHLSLINIVETLADNLDKVLIFHYLGAVELAVYSFAIAMPEQIKAYYGSVTRLILPRFAARTIEDIRSSMFQKMASLFLMSSVVMIAYLIAAPYIFKYLFPQYLPAVFYSQVYALSLLSVTFSPVGTALTAKRRTKDQYIRSIFLAFFQIGTVISFIHIWGLMGLVFARIAVRYVGGLTYYFFYTRIPDEKEN